MMNSNKAYVCLKGLMAAVLLSAGITGCGSDAESAAEGNGKIELLNVVLRPDARVLCRV